MPIDKDAQPHGEHGVNGEFELTAVDLDGIRKIMSQRKIVLPPIGGGSLPEFLGPGHANHPKKELGA
jgi:hypothetical protein